MICLLNIFLNIHAILAWLIKTRMGKLVCLSISLKRPDHAKETCQAKPCSWWEKPECEPCKGPYQRPETTLRFKLPTRRKSKAHWVFNCLTMSGCWSNTCNIMPRAESQSLVTCVLFREQHFVCPIVHMKCSFYMMLDTERDVPRSRSHQALSTCWLRSQRAAAWHGVLPTQYNPWQGVLPTQYNPWHGKSHVWREIGRQVQPRGIKSENSGI